MDIATMHGLGRVLLSRWRREAGLSRSRAAAALGISTRMLAYYEDGLYEVPKAVTLAVRTLAAEAGIRLPGGGMDRARWVCAVGHAVAYGRGEPVVGRLIREGRHAALRDLLQLFRDGPPPDLALTDPALFRTLREAGSRALLSGVGTLRVPPSPVATAGRAGDDVPASSAA